MSLAESLLLIRKQTSKNDMWQPMLYPISSGGLPFITHPIEYSIAIAYCGTVISRIHPSVQLLNMPPGSASLPDRMSRQRCQLLFTMNLFMSIKPSTAAGRIPIFLIEGWFHMPNRPLPRILQHVLATTVLAETTPHCRSDQGQQASRFHLRQAHTILLAGSDVQTPSLTCVEPSGLPRNRLRSFNLDDTRIDYRIGTSPVIRDAGEYD
jgi:hypothetical protein